MTGCIANTAGRSSPERRLAVNLTSLAAARVPSTVKLPPFQQLLDAHGRDVHRFLVATVGRDAADDCYQETWLAALRAYPRLRDAIEPTELDPDGRAPQGDRSPPLSRRARRCPVGEVPDRPAGPRRPRCRGLRDGELWALVRDLPNKQRTALALRYVADAAVFRDLGRHGHQRGGRPTKRPRRAQATANGVRAMTDERCTGAGVDRTPRGVEGMRELRHCPT